MHSYAQTYIQLLNQLKENGYSKEELVRVKNSYQMAAELFAGCYRPSGKTFIAHVVGTASILASLAVSLEIVIAGLLHSIYAEADFGSGKQGISNTKREQVKAVVGKEVEEYLCRYAALQWNAKTILSLRDRLHCLDQIDRNVLLIRLADQLEDSLDLGILYCSNRKDRQQFLQDMGDIMVAMAQEIGFPTLATELEAVFPENILAELPEELSPYSQYKDSFFIAPKSYQKKIWLAAYEELNHSLSYGQSIIYRLKRKLRSLQPFKKIAS
ncbi:DUF6817 domain-containing protein [Aerosakkonemataceae cyanobacterium BLCC-F154]|uniref:DUF6817 domain-containing protein n=1 Tax=Floridaenema fluviatile BLCC-F154 TaxID=3153640 RepID=A0ABV4YMG6_9CYAN